MANNTQARKPPPPPLSQRTTSSAQFGVSNPTPGASPALPPPPTPLMHSPFDGQGQDQYYDQQYNAEDEYGIGPEDQVGYYDPVTPYPSGEAYYGDVYYDEYGNEIVDGYYEDGYYEGYDGYYGDQFFDEGGNLYDPTPAPAQTAPFYPSQPAYHPMAQTTPSASRPAGLVKSNSQSSIPSSNPTSFQPPTQNNGPMNIAMRNAQSERNFNVQPAPSPRPMQPLATSGGTNNPSSPYNSNPSYDSPFQQRPASNSSGSAGSSASSTSSNSSRPTMNSATSRSDIRVVPAPNITPANMNNNTMNTGMNSSNPNMGNVNSGMNTSNPNMGNTGGGFSAASLKPGQGGDFVFAPMKSVGSSGSLLGNTAAREAIAPFNFDPAAKALEAQQAQVPRKRSTNPIDGKSILKLLYVQGQFPLSARAHQGQTISDCFVGWQLVQWLQQRMSMQLPQARETFQDLLTTKMISLAVALPTSKPTIDDLEQALFKLAPQAVAAGAPLPPGVRPAPPPGRPASQPGPAPASATGTGTTSGLPPPPMAKTNSSAALNTQPGVSTTNNPVVDVPRERPTKFLRRTTREMQSQQAERAREASWISETIRSDWNVSIWDDEAQHATQIVLSKDDQGQTVVDAGTLNSLIRHLSSELTDMTYTKTFFVTYKAFVTREVLLPKLLQRFLVPSSFAPNLVKTIQVRVVNAVLKWLELAPNDWDQELIEQLESFVRMIRQSPEAAQHEPLMKKLDKAIVEVLEGVDKERRAQHLAPPPAPILPKAGFKTTGLQLFFDLDSLELARQMTLMDWRLFSQIKSTEMLNCAWSSEKLKHRSPHVLAMISQFNKWSNWVATIITLQPSVKIRAKVMSKFIEVASNLRALNNFSGAISILSGLNNAAVYRLNKTKELLKEKYKLKFDQLTPLVDTSRSHQNYRNAIRQAVPPVLPHLGVFLTDLTFMNDGNKDVVNTNMINFKKHQMVYDVITQVRQFQLENYNLEPQPTIQEFLTLRDDQMRTDNQLYEMSLKVEPREPTQ